MNEGILFGFLEVRDGVLFPETLPSGTVPGKCLSDMKRRVFIRGKKNKKEKEKDIWAQVATVVSFWLEEKSALKQVESG